MDRIINVQVTGCTVKKDSKNAGVQGEANAATLRITFSPEWEALSKKIIWLDAGGGNPVAKILATETDGAFETTIPGEPLTKSGQCCFTIQGVKDSIVAMAVTEHLDVLPNDSYGMKAGNAADPTPSVADQLTGDVAALAKTVAALGKAMVNPIDKTADMTSPVGRDEDGKLWTAPGGAISVTADAIEKALGYTPADKKAIPTALPSPHALTFTGAVTGIYDGSQDVEVDMPGGGHLISHVTLEEEASEIVITETDDGDPLSLQRFVINAKIVTPETPPSTNRQVEFVVDNTTEKESTHTGYGVQTTTTAGDVKYCSKIVDLRSGIAITLPQGNPIAAYNYYGTLIAYYSNSPFEHVWHINSAIANKMRIYVMGHMNNLGKGTEIYVWGY